MELSLGVVIVSYPRFLKSSVNVKNLGSERRNVVVLLSKPIFATMLVEELAPTVRTHWVSIAANLAYSCKVILKSSVTKKYFCFFRKMEKYTDATLKGEGNAGLSLYCF